MMLKNVRILQIVISILYLGFFFYIVDFTLNHDL